MGVEATQQTDRTEEQEENRKCFRKINQIMHRRDFRSFRIERFVFFLYFDNFFSSIVSTGVVHASPPHTPVVQQKRPNYFCPIKIEPMDDFDEPHSPAVEMEEVSAPQVLQNNAAPAIVEPPLPSASSSSDGELIDQQSGCSQAQNAPPQTPGTGTYINQLNSPILEFDLYLIPFSLFQHRCAPSSPTTTGNRYNNYRHRHGAI